MCMSSPKISIIVPVYNAEKCLNRCIDSILSQSFSDFELLLIDDGSRDESGAICEEYSEKDKRVRVFHKENGGVSSTRNVGLDKAIGEYLCFCDSDDYVDSDWLSNFTDYFPSEMIIQGFKWQKEKDVRWSYVKNQSGTFGLIEALISLYSLNNMGYLWCRCFKASIIKKYNIRFIETYQLREDYEFITSYCTHVTRVSLVSSCSYNYFMPNYSGTKYNKVKIEEDIKCTLSILQNLFLIYEPNYHNDIVCSEINRLRGDLFKGMVCNNTNIKQYFLKYQAYRTLSSSHPSNIREYIKESFLFLWKIFNA